MSLVFSRIWKSVAGCALIAFSTICCSPAAMAQQSTTTTLQVTSAGAPVTSVASGAPVTLIAMVNGGSSAVNGQVRFCDTTVSAECNGAAILGIAQVQSSGKAIFTAHLVNGLHTLKAIFSGTNALASSFSSTPTLAIGSTASGILTLVSSGSQGNYTLTATLDSAHAHTAPTGSIEFRDTSYGNRVITSAPLSTGAGTFHGTTLHSNVQLNHATVSADFDNDGLPDIVAPSSSNTHIGFLHNNGDGTYQIIGTPSPLVDDSYLTSASYADINRDGNLDLIVEVPRIDTTPRKVLLFLGNGDGTFQTAMTVTDAPGIVVGDFDGDGFLDLAGSGDTASGAVRVIYGNGDGTFSAPVMVPDTAGITAITDYNGDGRADFISSNVVMLGKSDRTFSAAPSGSLSVTSAVIPADVNADGRVDVVAELTAGAMHTVQLQLGNGDGTMQSPVSLSVPLDPAYFSAAFKTAFVKDFDGDGKQDIAVVYNIAKTRDDAIRGDSFLWLAIYRGNGDGTFAAPAPYVDQTANQDALIVLSNDFNGDGGAEIGGLNLAWGAAHEFFSFNDTYVATATGVSVSEQGDHLVHATYIGDGQHAAAISNSITLSSASTETSPVIVWQQPAPIAYGTALSSTQLNAIAQTTEGAPIAGTFTYMPPLGTMLEAGTHTLSVHFTPTDTAHYTEADASVSISVSAIAPVVTLTVGGSQHPGAPTIFTVTVTGSGATPTGSVTVFEGANVYGTAPLNNGSAQIAYTYSASGSHLVQASYSGDAYYTDAFSATRTATVGKTKPVIVWNTPSAITYGTALSAAQLNATATDANGAPLAGTFSYLPAAGNILTPGMQTLSTTFTPADAATYDAATKSVSLTVHKAPTSIAIARTAPATSSIGVSVNATFKATVTASAGLATGQVSFFDGSTELGTSNLDSGVATLTTSFSTVGAHTITAVYSGDPYFEGSASPVYVQTVEVPNLSITASPDSFTVHQGETGTSIITLTPTGGYKGTIDFACNNLPHLATCTFAPASITMTGNNAVQTTVLTVQTHGPAYATSSLRNDRKGLQLATLLGLPLLLLGAARRRMRNVPGLLVTIFAAALLMPAVGCGVADSVTPTGTSHVEVVAQASAGSSAQAQSIQINVTITR